MLLAKGQVESSEGVPTALAVERLHTEFEPFCDSA